MVAGKGNNPIEGNNEKIRQEQSHSLRLIIRCERQLNFEYLKMQVAEGCGLEEDSEGSASVASKETGIQDSFLQT